MTDVFISYAHADKAWVNGELLPRLKTWGIDYSIDRESFLPGQHLTVAILEAVAAATHVLFVGEADTHRLRDVLQALSDAPVLLVGEKPRFAHNGGVINFYRRAGSIRFEVNIGAARRHALEIDAKLLRLARIVRN